MRSRRLFSAVISAAALVAVPAIAGASPESIPPEPPEKPQRGYVAEGVSVGGVEIGGLTRNAAVSTLLAERVKPAQRKIAVRAGKTRFGVNPRAAGLSIDVRYAVRAAYNFGRSRPVPGGGVNVPLPIRINEGKVEAIVASRAKRFDRSARDATIRFRGATPIITKARAGREIVQERAVTQLTRGLLTQRRRVTFPTRAVAPATTTPPPTVLVNRSQFQLTLFANGSRHNFPVAVGQPAYPTPAGSYTITSKITNPTWFPPDSPWAAGIGPVPPGAGNPLGTRWMGFDRHLIGIHGTPVPSSLGSRASHGCIRMSIPQAEWLYDRLGVGSRVVVV